MKKALILVVSILATVHAYAQSDYYTSKSTSLEIGRYEIVASDIVARLTFKVDKYTGEVYQLVQDSDGQLLWEIMYKLEGCADVQKEGQINYQLFTSGKAVRYTFLMNINTGTTWVLSEDTSNRKNPITFWAPME